MALRNGYVKLLETIHADQLTTQKILGEHGAVLAKLKQQNLDLHDRIFGSVGAIPLLTGSITHLEQKLDEEFNKESVVCATNRKDLGDRLTTVESRIHYFSGAAGAVGVALGLGSRWLVAHIFGGK